MYRKNKGVSNIIIYCCLVLILCIFLGNISFSRASQRKNILILRAECKNYININELMEGIRDKLGNNKDFNIHIDIINSRNNNIYEMYKIYKERFQHNKFDIVIPCDNISLEFTRKYQNQLFKNMPIIFCNITDDFNYTKLDHSYFTGIINQPDIKSTLNTALKLHPDTRKIMIVNDQSFETINKEKIRKTLDSGYDIEYISCENVNSKEFQDRIQAVNGNVVLLCFGVSKNNAKDMCIFNIKNISSTYRIPSYSISEALIDKGIIGGMMPSGYEHGENVAEIILRILNGEKVKDIPIIKDDSNRFLFDYIEMNKFGIELSDIPKDSEVINKDNYGFYVSRKQFFYKIIPTFIFFLIVIIVIQLINISKLKKVKQKLKKSEERLRTIINATPDLIFIKDGEGKLLDCNKSFLNAFSLNYKGCIGKYAFELAQTNDIYRQSYVSSINKDQKVWEKGRLIQVEDKIVYSDGRTKVFDLIKVPIYEDNGNPRGIVGLARDITTRKQIENKLRESEERYRTLLELLPVTVCLHYEDIIHFVNKAGAEIVGTKDADELIGRSIYEFLHPNYHEMFKEKIEQLYNKGITITSLDKEKLITVDGECIDIECISKCLFYDGKEMILSVMSDIRERKRVEELSKNIKDKEKLLNETLEYDKLRTEFFANVSHELRTPLNIILGVAQMFKILIDDKSLDNNPKSLKKYLNMIEQNTYRLIRIVNNLIDITKMDSGFYEINFQNCDIVNIVENITSSVAKYIEDKKIELIFDTDVEEKIIACDPDKIEKIMLNLLSNATKFSKDNGKIRVNMYDKVDSVVISVKDNGIGIPNEKLKEVFEKFKQVDKSFKRSHEGCGVGLSLVKVLVEMHGGIIYAKSQYNVGSEFIIELPAHVITDKGINPIDGDMKENHVERINIEFSDIYK
ncbi:sensor histidine kinase [Maledivibacter halophilus]|uniref:histidine kinase n=1 Tax=Maledivibacter halophilus TaxID=36842 RepID=A0A1T5IJ86_9FIRM|nr:ABC transporter substrate binding protein [Maledivibacter halophilus]SKC39053.1 PAS domain S-box-containing protein [Maledivibacter halophilus]